MNLELYSFLINLNFKTDIQVLSHGEFSSTFETTWVWEPTFFHCEFDKIYTQIKYFWGKFRFWTKMFCEYKIQTLKT